MVNKVTFVGYRGGSRPCKQDLEFCNTFKFLPRFFAKQRFCKYVRKSFFLKRRVTVTKQFLTCTFWDSTLLWL